MNSMIMRYVEALTSQIGVAGLVLMVLVGGGMMAALMMSSRGGPIMVWLYVLFNLAGAGISTSAEAMTWRQPVLPVPMITFCASIRWLLLMALGVSGLIVLLSGAAQRGGKMLVVLAFWALLMLVTAIAGETGSMAMERFATVLLVILASAVVYRSTDTPEGLHGFMRVSFYFSLVFAVLTLLALAARPGLVLAGGRFRGFLDNPNQMGWATLVFMLPSLWIWLDPAVPKGKLKKLGLPCSLLLLAFMAATASRGSILALLPLLVVVVRVKARQPLFWIGAIVLGGVALGALTTFGTEKSLTHLASFESASRIHHIKFGLGEIARSPVIGHGFGYSDIYGQDPATGLGVHNSIIKIGMDMGILGLIALATMFAIAWSLRKHLVSALRQVGYVPVLPMLWGAMVTAHLLNSLVEGWLTGVGSAQLFVFFVALNMLGAMQVNSFGFPAEDIEWEEEEWYAEEEYAVPG